MLLQGTHERGLVLRSLETTMAKLGRSVNELQLDLFQSLPLGVDEQGLRGEKRRKKNSDVFFFKDKNQTRMI